MAALQALRILATRGQLRQAVHTWQGSVFVPGGVYFRRADLSDAPQDAEQGAGDGNVDQSRPQKHPVGPAFLVLAQAVYAARAWPVEMTSEGNVLVPPDREWEWLVCAEKTEFQQWLCVGNQNSWVLSRHKAGDFGFLQMAMECPRPALAEALLQTGRKRLTCNQVKRFAVASKHALGHGPEEEKKFLEHVLEGHPQRESLLSLWRPRPAPKKQAKAQEDQQSSGASSVPEEVEG